MGTERWREASRRTDPRLRPEEGNQHDGAWCLAYTSERLGHGGTGVPARVQC